MNMKAIRVLVVAASFVAIAAFSASAMPTGRQVPADENIVQFFAKNGVDTQYLTLPQSAVPADVWQKMNALVSDPTLNSLILTDLRVDGAAFGDSLYLQIGNTDFEWSRTASGAQESFSMSTSS